MRGRCGHFLVLCHHSSLCFAFRFQPSPNRLHQSSCQQLWEFARSRLASGGASTSHTSPLHVICRDPISSHRDILRNRALTKVKDQNWYISQNSNHQQQAAGRNFKFLHSLNSFLLHSASLRIFSLPVSSQCGSWLPAIAIKENKKPNNITANNLSPDHKALAGGCQQLALRPWPVVQVCLCCRTKLASWPLDGFATTSIRLVPSSSRPDPGPTPRTYL